jgi:hypothetical protein
MITTRRQVLRDRHRDECDPAPALGHARPRRDPLSGREDLSARLLIAAASFESTVNG